MGSTPDRARVARLVSFSFGVLVYMPKSMFALHSGISVGLVLGCVLLRLLFALRKPHGVASCVGFTPDRAHVARWVTDSFGVLVYMQISMFALASGLGVPWFVLRSVLLRLLLARWPRTLCGFDTRQSRRGTFGHRLLWCICVYAKIDVCT